MDSNEVGQIEIAQGFNDWFWQVEGFHLLAERFYEEFQHDMDPPRAAAWLQAAFEAGVACAVEQQRKMVRTEGPSGSR